MDWHQPLNQYCERLDSGLLAEPVNLLTNLAFIIAALFAWRKLKRLHIDSRDIPLVSIVLVWLLALIGVGSALFHSVATYWAMLADVIPIGIFILVYVGAAYRVIFQASLIQTIIGYGILAMLTYFFQQIIDPATVNHSQNYFGAVAMVFVIGWHTLRLHHPSAGRIFAAGLIICLSLVFRAADMEVCEQFSLGTHFLWHICNSFALYLLVTACRRSHI